MNIHPNITFIFEYSRHRKSMYVQRNSYRYDTMIIDCMHNWCTSRKMCSSCKADCSARGTLVRTGMSSPFDLRDHPRVVDSSIGLLATSTCCHT